jgi:TonB family protein
MNRLQQKCLLASGGLHGLLVLILLVGPGFFTPRRQAPDLPLLKMIPTKVVDEAFFSPGGNPLARPNPPVARAEEPPAQSLPSPRPPEPPRPKPERFKPADPPAEPARAPKEAGTKPPVKETATQPGNTRGIKVDPKLVVRRRGENAAARSTSRPRPSEDRNAEAESQRQAVEEIRTSWNKALSTLKDGLSGNGTTIDLPGPGREAYANYAQVVRSIYDQAWIDPDQVSDDSATVRVEVVVVRDGTVASQQIVQRSGIPALDKSIEEALNRVRLRGLPPFPEGARENQRTFIIQFNLKAKRLLG